MVMKWIALIVGALVLGVGLFYLLREWKDRDSRKIYGILSAVGGVVFLGMLLLLVLG